MNDLFYLKQAYLEAKSNSTDPSTQNGAILVDGMSGEIISYGSNHFPFGVKESPERWERPAKYAWVEHAERNSIFAAARQGTSTKGLIMYCPWFACTDCARAIIQAGIRKVIGHDTSVHLSGSQSWKDSIAIAYQMFDEAGVRYKHIPGEMGLTIRFNGKETEV